VALVTNSRTPANNYHTEATSITLEWTAHTTAGEDITDSLLAWRISGGSWQYERRSWPAGTHSVAHTRRVFPDPGDLVQWFVGAIYVSPGGGGSNYQSATWSAYRDRDTTAPVIAGVLPASGNVAPGSSGVAFQCNVTDNVSLAWVRLYIDGVLEQSWVGSGAKSYTKKLALGPHTYRFEAADGSGNTASTGNINITVINGLPAVPPGAIAVADQTGAVAVANLGHVAVTWPAFLDGNPEDILTYTLENRPAGGTWTPVATGIDGLSYDWSPDIGLGAAELRVKANDGTGDSGYLARAQITIVSSQSPTAPVLVTPAGGENWREGETHTIEFTPATHPEGLPIVIEAEFSALGDFSDAVPVGIFANSGDEDWTLGTDLV
jgi:hypothetical protein